MKEISLHVLDIAKNSVTAGADLIEILLSETEDLLTLQIKDNGCGMSKEILHQIENPFYTTRTTRRVGLGIPLLKMAAEQTGGALRIESRQAVEFPESHGTTVSVTFVRTHIDFVPLGDMISTVITLIQGNEEIDFLYLHEKDDGKRIKLDTRELRQVLGGEIPLNEPEILSWINDFLGDQYKA